MVYRRTQTGLDPKFAIGPDHTHKFTVPMTAVPVAPRHMGFSVLRAQEKSGSVAQPGFPRIQQVGGDTQDVLEGATRLVHTRISRGGMATHPGLQIPVWQYAPARIASDSAQGGSHVDGPNSRQIPQQTGERAQGGDQAPLASIARVRASKS